MNQLEVFRKVELLGGIVDLTDNSYTDLKGNKLGVVKRGLKGSRKRPNAERRHDPVLMNCRTLSMDHFISDTHLEWLSLNYRKEKAARISPSRKRMVLLMYQKQPSYFPTIREIRDELIEGQSHFI